MTTAISKIAICGNASPLAKKFISELKKIGFDTVVISKEEINKPSQALVEKISGCYAVCNIPELSFVAKWTDKYVYDLYCKRLLAIRTLASAIKQCENRPKVFVSVTDALMYDSYEIHDDYSNIFGNTFTSEVGQMETQESLKIIKGEPNIRLVIARCGFIMHRNGGLFSLLRKMAHAGFSSGDYDGLQCIPIVHVNDAAKIIIDLMSNVQSQGVYNVTIPQITSIKEICDAILKYDSQKYIIVPKFIIRRIIGRSYTLLEQNSKVIPYRLVKSGIEFFYNDADSIIKNLLNK